MQSSHAPGCHVDRLRNRRALWVFFAIAFGVSWILDVLPVVFPATLGPFRRILVVSAMWGPGLGALVAVRTVLERPLVPFFRLRAWRGRATYGRLFATGVIWGIWHVPVIVQGHNYPGHPWIGIPMMVVATSFVGVEWGATRPMKRDSYEWTSRRGREDRDAEVAAVPGRAATAQAG